MFQNLSWGTRQQIYNPGGGEERVAREREEDTLKQREEALREETTHSAEEGMAEKHARTDRSDTEIDTCTEGG